MDFLFFLYVHATSLQSSVQPITSFPYKRKKFLQSIWSNKKCTNWTKNYSIIWYHSYSYHITAIVFCFGNQTLHMNHPSALTYCKMLVGVYCSLDFVLKRKNNAALTWVPNNQYFELTAIIDRACTTPELKWVQFSHSRSHSCSHPCSHSHSSSTPTPTQKICISSDQFLSACFQFHITVFLPPVCMQQIPCLRITLVYIWSFLSALSSLC